jgi:type VI secretion system protein VasD
MRDLTQLMHLRSLPRLPTRCAYIVAILVALASSAGCASVAGVVLDKALDIAGYQPKPPTPAVSPEDLASIRKLPKKVTLRIHAGDVLNTDPAGRSLSLVARLYKLKESDAFLQAPYDTFKDAPGDKPGPIQGAVDVREIVLTPGQKYEVVETVPNDATYLAVVALFRAPDPSRWRFVFDTKEAAKTGITLGVHGCALSVSEGHPVDAPPETMRLAGVHCQ